MNVGKPLAAIGHHIADHKKAYAAVGLGAAGIGVLAACTSTAPPKEGATVASDNFGTYDANGNGSIEAGEARVNYVENGSTKHVTSRENLHNGYDLVSGYTERYRQPYAMSIEKLHRAAGGADAIASWQEIGEFAVKTYDAPNKEGVKDGMLDGKEVSKFLKDYGAQRFNTGNREITGVDRFAYKEMNSEYWDYHRPRDVDPGPRYDDTRRPGGSGYDPGPPRYDDTGRGSGRDDNPPAYTPDRPAPTYERPAPAPTAPPRRDSTSNGNPSEDDF